MAVRTIVSVTAFNYRAFHSKDFPPRIMVVGDNWAYAAGLKYQPRSDCDYRLPGGIVLRVSEAFMLFGEKSANSILASAWNKFLIVIGMI